MRHAQRGLVAVEQLVAGAIVETIQRQPVGGRRERLIGQRRVVDAARRERPDRAVDRAVGRAEDIAVVATRPPVTVTVRSFPCSCSGMGA